MRSLRKVKAHQEERPDESDDERLCRLGNDWADEKAKCGARLHPSAVPAISKCCDQMWRDAQAACAVLGCATTDWPDAAGMLQRPRPRSTRQGRAAAADSNKQRRKERQAKRINDNLRRHRHVCMTHRWAAVGAGNGQCRERCVDCLMWKREGITACTGVTGAWAACIDTATAKGHVLQRGLLHAAGRGTPMQLLACTRCGSYTTGAKLLGLADECHPPTLAGQSSLSRMAAGKHPKPGRHPEWYSAVSAQLA